MRELYFVLRPSNCMVSRSVASVKSYVLKQGVHTRKG